MPGLFTAASGARLSFEEAGAGPPLLAVHGLGGGAWFFAGMARRLADRYRVIAVDLPGTGRSTASSSGMSIEQWSADLTDLLTRHIGEPAVLLGHSMGTILALDMARRAPAALRGVLFVGGLPRPLPAIRERLARRAEAVAREGMAGTGAAVAAANFSPATLRRDPELVGLFERLFEAQEPLAYAHCCRVLMNASAEALVGPLASPALAVSGLDDQYAPPDEVARFVARVPGCRHHLLDDCGHFPFLEQPEAFAAAVAGFVAAL